MKLKKHSFAVKIKVKTLQNMTKINVEYTLPPPPKKNGSQIMTFYLMELAMAMAKAKRVAWLVHNDHFQ